MTLGFAVWRFPHAQLAESSLRQLTRQVLFLSVFSGPVEGILMIIAIYVVTGFYGARARLDRADGQDPHFGTRASSRSPASTRLTSFTVRAGSRTCRSTSASCSSASSVCSSTSRAGAPPCSASTDDPARATSSQLGARRASRSSARCSACCRSRSTRRPTWPGCTARRRSCAAT